jgi:hypothetical protein
MLLMRRLSRRRLAPCPLTATKPAGVFSCAHQDPEMIPTGALDAPSVATYSSFAVIMSPRCNFKSPLSVSRGRQGLFHAHATAKAANGVRRRHAPWEADASRKQPDVRTATGGALSAGSPCVTAATAHRFSHPLDPKYPHRDGSFCGDLWGLASGRNQRYSDSRWGASDRRLNGRQTAPTA